MAFKRISLLTGLLFCQSAFAQGFTISNIEVQGLQRVALGAVLLRMPVRVGDTLEPEDASAIINSLYATGNFDDVSILRDGNTLVVQVAERPTIAEITFAGNKSIKDEQLQENLDASGVRVGEALDRTALTEIEQALEDFYYSVGKYNATVQAVVTPLPRNRTGLKFVFSEGLSASIQQINFIGNTVFSDDELLNLFDLNVDVSWWNFLADDKYQKQVLAGDLEKLRTHYYKYGYLKFDVESTQVSMSPDKKGIYITLNINEGQPYKIKSVNFRGDLIGKQAEFEAMIPFKVGDTYNGDLVTQLEENIKATLGESGYAYPDVQNYPEFDDNTSEVALTFNVDPSRRMYVRDIRFIGNNLTKDEVLRREMRQMESTYLNANAIDLGKSRLDRLGYFESTSIQTARVAGTDDQVDVIYTVNEANSGSMNFGIGYGTTSGISFQAGLQQDNFMGTGDRVGINALRNDYQTNVNLEYKDPYWTLDGVSFGGNIFYTEFDAEDANLIEYTNKSYGIGFDWGFPINELNYVGLGVGYTHHKISDLPDYVQINSFLNAQQSNIEDDVLDVNEFDISLSWTRNNLNQSYFPTSGNHQRATFDITVPGSDAQYFKAQYDAKQYFPLTSEHDYVLLFRTRLAFGDGYGQNDGQDNLLPFYENYYAGGFSTLRGFSANTIGPKAIYSNGTGYYKASDDTVGGNALAMASLELIVPTPFASEEARNSLRTSVFLDAANVWDTNFDYQEPTADMEGSKYYYDYSDPMAFRYSYGAALQWMSPMGPLVFSVAKPIEKYEGDDEEFFSFSIGRTF